MSLSAVLSAPAKAYAYAHSLIVRDGAPATSTGLQPSVIAAVPRVFGPWEGAALPYMYTDSKGYVTTGTGNEIDSPAAAIAAGTWHHGEGGPVASPDEAAAGWQAVKDGYPGTQSTASASLSDLRLDQASLDALMARTITSFWSVLRGEFANADALPADGQMMLVSNSWAWGPGFPRVWGSNGQAFVDAMNARDYAKASQIMQAANAHEITINPGIAPRVAGQVVMLANAAKSRNPATLYYPGSPPTGIGGLFNVGALPWKSALVLGGAGALAAGPVGLAAGLAAAVGGRALAPRFAPVTARVQSALARVRAAL